MNSKWSRCVEKGKLKKGPWTFEEDIRLLRYIRVHGDGRWTTLAKAAGLQRCGKSCRLRWVNYLRPGIKRGNITPEEERLIIDLHAGWGNRWSLIAERIPGRTDNEIKNYWRSHLKKKLQKLAQTADQTSAISQVQPKQVESLDVFACKEIKPPSSYEDNYSHGAVKLETPMHIEGIDLQVQCCTQSSFLDSNQEETSIENGMAMAMVRADADELPPMLYSFPSGIPIESDATAIFEDSYCASELYGEYGCESEEVADIMLWNMCPIPNMELDTPFLSATHPLGHVNGQMPFSSLNVI